MDPVPHTRNHWKRPIARHRKLNKEVADIILRLRRWVPAAHRLLLVLVTTSPLIAWAAAAPASPIAGGYLDHAVLSVSNDGRETFSALPLDPGMTYRVRVTGTVPILESSIFGASRRDADAAYVTDNNWNFTDRRDVLTFNCAAALVSEDVSTHTYIYEINGNGQKLRIHLAERGQADFRFPPNALAVELTKAGPQPPWILSWLVFLAVWVGLPVAVVMMIRPPFVRWLQRQREEEEIRRAAAAAREAEEAVEKAAAEQAKREEQQRAAWRAAEAARERRFCDLVVRFEKLDHYESEEFLSVLARRDRAKFIRQKELILTEYVALQQDQLLSGMLRRRRPDIWRRLTADVELLRRAEVVDVLGDPPNLDFYTELSHYEDDSFVEDYARTHTARLLADRKRIFADYDRLHQHKDFVEQLKAERPHIYRRALWEIRALGSAERIDAKPGQKKTSDEFRAAKLKWEEVKATDEIEAIEMRLRKVEELRQRLEQNTDLDPERRELLIQAFSDSLEGDQSLPGRVY